MVSGKLRTAHLTPENLVTEAETDLKARAQDFIKKNQVRFFVKHRAIEDNEILQYYNNY